MIGYDNLSERYVAHWLDFFGGRFSETLGSMVRVPATRSNLSSSIRMVPSALFYRWMADKKQWQWQNADEENSGNGGVF